MGHVDVGAPAVRASHHSLSGCRHGEQPKHTLLARADAAHMAGIAEIGACADDLGAWDHKTLRRLLREHKVRVAEVEWIDLGEPEPEAESDLFTLAAICGARQVNVGVCGPDMYPDGYLAHRLREVAVRAGDLDMTVAFEPVVFGTVAHVAHVEHIIDKAGQPNVGTLLDVYHLARLQWDSLDEVTPELVAGVQVNGIARSVYPPTWPCGLLHESQCNRLMPDEGDLDVERWLNELRGMGVTARLSVEVLSDHLRSLPLFDAADQVAVSGRKFASVWEAPLT